METPELPANKKFHVFVCYNSHNFSEVRTIVKNLEDRGLKCCNHDRDFLPGGRVWKNIYDGIKESTCMLIVLTKEFADSKYCEHEIDVALHTEMTEDYFLIPVKIEPCSIPDCIRHLSYIDAENEDISNVHFKIAEAIANREIQKTLEKIRNGESIAIPLQARKQGYLSLSRYKMEISQDITQDLENEYLVTAEMLETAKTIINASTVVRYRHIFLNTMGLITAVFILLAILYIAIVLLMVVTTSDVKSQKVTATGIVLSVGAPVLFVTWVVLICLDFSHQWRLEGPFHEYAYKEQNAMNSSLWRYINSKNVKRSKIILFFDNGALHIMRYNLKPCKDYFLRKLDSNQSARKLKTSEETDKEYTNRVFDLFLSNHVVMLNFAYVEDGKVRHKTANATKCVCLMVENSLQDAPVPRRRQLNSILKCLEI